MFGCCWYIIAAKDYVYFKILIVQENVRQILINTDISQLQNIIAAHTDTKFVAE